MNTLPQKKTATFVKKVSVTGEGRVYRLDPPIPVSGAAPSEYVWVSAVNVPYAGPETYIFPCDSTGEVTGWLELPGSFRGALDHESALRGAGYEVQS